MSTYVEECRREWKRLGVPELLADEMATDLEADLAEAEADGVSAAEILGESDPRRFAETWASERGLVSEPPQQKKSRKRFWIGLALGLVLLGFLLGIAGVAFLATPTLHVQTAPPAQASPRTIVSVPNLVGMKACHARRVAMDIGLVVRGVPRHDCSAVVVAQTPAPGAAIPRYAPQAAVVLRLRATRR